MEFNKLIEILKRYNAGEINLTDEQAERLSQMAFQMKRDFKVRSKPIRKGLFDLVDTAALGLVPNHWRPRSIGQELHGESGLDKFAGGVGTVAGLGVPVAGAIGVASKYPQMASAVGKGARTGLEYGKRYGRQGWESTKKGARYGRQKVSDVAEAIKKREAVQRSLANLKYYYNRGANKAMNYGSDYASRAVEWWKYTP